MSSCVKDSRILFLAIKAVNLGTVNAKVVEALSSVLLKSENAAIANRALMLEGQINKMKENGYYV